VSPKLPGMNDRRIQTKDLLEKIPNFPSLYRHSVNGTYYGIKELSGKKKTHSLDTTDRKFVERRLLNLGGSTVGRASPCFFRKSVRRSFTEIQTSVAFQGFHE
jgi:hypothetical protein